MSTQLSLSAIFDLLTEMKLSPTLQKENEQIFILLQIAKREVPVFFGIRSNNALLQMIAYLPYELPEKTTAQVARLFHILNKELDMPGFGIDETQKLMFYRAVVPCLNGELNQTLFEHYLSTSKRACETFMDAIAMIAGGMATVDDALKRLRKKP